MGAHDVSNAIENARKRLAEIRHEAEEIERFIAMYERFDVGKDNVTYISGSTQLRGNLSTDSSSVDNPIKTKREHRRGARPSQIASIMERVIREVGRPMTRGEIVEALELREVEIPAQDKARYIGTIAWRNKGTFINIEGRGYWLRDTPNRVKSVPSSSDPPEEHSGELFTD